MSSLVEPRVIEVPIDNSNDVLEIDCSQLPSHASEICDILENEGSALRFYQLFALEYYKQGQVEEAVVALKRGMAKAKANDQTAKVPLLNLLASIYVQKAKSTTGNDRDIMLKMATALLTEASRIDGTEANTHVIGGMLDLGQRRADAALAHFESALRTAPRSVAALLGKARVLLSKHRYQQALAVYQQVLVLRPAGTRPDPRIGIGLCLHRLGHSDDARRALLRACEVDPAAAAPHILLATMDLNDVKRMMDPSIGTAAHQLSPSDILSRAMGHLHRAYTLQPDSAATLIRLADRLFFQAQFDAARRLAERALQSADTMAMQAEAHYQAGRAAHALKRFDVAYDAYQKCVGINSSHHLALMGLGQMQLHRTDMSSAEATFQRVLDAHPRCVEALRALAYLHARLPNTKPKALEYYEREMQVLADDAPADANLFLEAGLLYEAVSAKKARRAYATAAGILGDSADALPELWNNLGALSHMTGDSNEAVFAEYDRAAQKCTAALAGARSRLAEMRKGPAAQTAGGASRAQTAASVQRLESTRATIAYNVARFYERCGLWGHAESLYVRLLGDVPAYTDARLRLAHISFFVKGSADSALAHIERATEADAKRAPAWLLRGTIELHRRSVQDARRAFEHVLKDIAKHDVYALCALGNFYLAAGRSEQARSEGVPKASELAAHNYRRALEFFDKCLQLDDRCAAAAHGTAIALAERGAASDARQVFQDVRDAATAGLGPSALSSELVVNTAFLPVGCDVLLWSGVNAAHALVEVGSFRQAVLAYEAELRRLQDTTRAIQDTECTQSFVVSSLEEEGQASEPAATRLTDLERSERKRLERDLRLYLVRALYIQAKAAKDISIMRTALDHIRSLCADENISVPKEDGGGDSAEASQSVSPDDCLILYDLALVEQSVAQLVSELPESQRTLPDLTSAAASIAHSAAAFSFLATWGKTVAVKRRLKLLFSPRLATERAGYSRSLVAKLERKLQEQEAFEQKRQENVEQWRRNQEEDEKKRRDQEEAATRAQRQLEEKLLRDAEERNAILREQMVASKQPQPDDMDVGPHVSDSPDMSAGATPLRRKKPPPSRSQVSRKSAAAGNNESRGRVRNKPESGHTDEDPDRPSSSAGRKRRNVGVAENEDPPTETTGKYKSKAIVTDSDDDDSPDNN